MKYKVVITDHVFPNLELAKRLLTAEDAELLYLNSKDPDVIREAVRAADALITCYAEITADIIKCMTKCRSISKTGIGYNNIDVEQATKQKIQVLNCTDYCIEEVSDTAVALALSLSRRIPWLINNIKSGNWSLEGCLDMHRLTGKKFGLWGFGKIARRVAEKMSPFGVEIIAFDPFMNTDTIAEYGGRKVELEELISTSDYLSLHLPLNAETRNTVNSDIFQRMKPTAFLLNTARGPLVNEPDLIDAVQQGIIAGAGLDVICDEKFDPKNPIFNQDNIIVTPHSAFHSVESTNELQVKILDDVICVLHGEEPKYKVNKI